MRSPILSATLNRRFHLLKPNFFKNLCFLLPVLFSINVCRAQSPAKGAVEAAPPSRFLKFDVVSIRPTGDSFTGTGYNYPEDGFWSKALPVRDVIEAAYGIFDERRILGLPSWSKSTRYDINAKVAPSEVQELQALSIEQRGALIKDLLADRFKMQAHLETRTLPIFVLRDAPPPQKLHPPAETIAGPKCLAKSESHPGHLALQNCDLEGLAKILSNILQREVINESHLTSHYDFDLTFNVTATQALTSEAPEDGGADSPSIFAALTEQLGLKLDRSKGPVTFLVIDRLETPSPN